LKGAAAAFEKITEIDPQNPDGWVNVGRCLVQEGDTVGARQVLERALAISPKLARTNFFYARVLREEGKYDEAAGRLQIVLVQYPRDRVAINELGRILFLQKRYAEAVKTFQQTLAIDPEDLQANYNLMLCYNGLGDEGKANEHKERYLRFKADESSQAITGAYRQAHPEDNGTCAQAGGGWNFGGGSKSGSSCETWRRIAIDFSRSCWGRWGAKTNDLDQDGSNGRGRGRQEGDRRRAQALSSGICDASGCDFCGSGGEHRWFALAVSRCAFSRVQYFWRFAVSGIASEAAPARNDRDNGLGDEQVPLLNRITRRVSASRDVGSEDGGSTEEGLQDSADQ
jgi:Tfp pilus assembly protein PilF